MCNTKAMHATGMTNIACPCQNVATHPPPTPYMAHRQSMSTRTYKRRTRELRFFSFACSSTSLSFRKKSLKRGEFIVVRDRSYHGRNLARQPGQSQGYLKPSLALPSCFFSESPTILTPSLVSRVKTRPSHQLGFVPAKVQVHYNYHVCFVQCVVADVTAPKPQV